jgi:CubicO group peptidase (beta-lactamase class C family)
MRGGRSFLMATLVALVVATVTPAVASSTSADPFAAVDASMRARVRDDGLMGGVVFVGRNGGMIHDTSVRAVDDRTIIPIASASKWLTSATLMTLVDEGKLALDTPVVDVLPAFRGAKQAVTARQLLSHTSGLLYDACTDDPTTTTAACTDEIATGPAPTTKPGSQFAYSGVGYEVAARIIEVLTGMSFEDAFERRIAVPLGMAETRFDRYGGQTTRHPAPAASATSTVSDYARFLTMLAADGQVTGGRVLSHDSVAEIERDQVKGLRTRHDDAVQITKIPTYGLGVWRDVVGPGDDARVVSGSGAYGFYPWIDRRHGTYGIIGVADLRDGSDYAVPRSQQQARMAWRAAARAAP